MSAAVCCCLLAFGGTSVGLALFSDRFDRFWLEGWK
jgi:hypothetical protein